MNEIRKAQVYYADELAGYLTEASEGYTFQYDSEFLKKNIPISVSLPPRAEPYQSKELFPFFKGLLPEGWYLDIVSTTQKIDSKDSFGLLLGTASADTAGTVTIRKVKYQNE
ncbi:MAG: HipA N-terminal domain-containing protein [Candidatus Omnitrophica bacterium]|nr:HipA N-terminal domain-containing protein [Candidatus Omnitrophota bacterium]